MSKEQLVELKIQKYMRAKELAKHLGIGLSTLYLYIKQGKFSGKKISEKVVVFEVAEVEKALFNGAL